LSRSTAGNRPSAPRQARDRQVVLVAAAIVAAVLGLQLISALVPAVGDVLGLAPILIGTLVLVTLVVLVRAVRPPAS
jgi:polyferredoxin